MPRWEGDGPPDLHHHLFKGALTGPSPLTVAGPAPKDHLLTDPSGIPLAISLTGGHRNDVTQLFAVRGRVQIEQPDCEPGPPVWDAGNRNPNAGERRVR